MNSATPRLQKMLPPSYLRELCIKNEQIYFVYMEDISKEDIPFPIKVETTIDDTLDITGSPLEVDLKGDISFTASEKIKVFDLWTEKEAKYLPLNIRKAREYINLHNRNTKSEIIQYEDIPIFAICHDDCNHTVVLGAQKSNGCIMTCKVDILGYLTTGHELLSSNHMERVHMLYIRTKDSKTAFTSKFKYYLYGTYIQNIRNIYDSECFGSICIEVKCNTKCIVESPWNLTNSKHLSLQVIVGHPSSPVNFLWKDLCLLQSYMDILSNPDKYNDPETAISSLCCNSADILKSLTSVIRSSLVKREIKLKFDLDNIRSENILDKLWSILKNCSDLATLRNSFHYFFEELAEPEVAIKIPDKNSSNIVEIIEGILEGKLAVPTITFAQALTFLFELGAEKLKNDYQNIHKNFYSLSERVIATKWSQLQSHLTLQNEGRKTRVTVTLKAGNTEVHQNILKLAYLGKLHAAAELIYLVKEEAFFRDETFDHFCEKIYESYIDKDDKIDFVDLKCSPLREFAIGIDLDDNFLKNEILVTWSTQMRTTTNNFEVTTIYHFSKSKIFPTTVYDRYDLSDEIQKDPKAYYVCKLEQFKDVI